MGYTVTQITEILMEVGQRGVILTLREFWSLIRKPDIHSYVQRKLQNCYHWFIMKIRRFHLKKIFQFLVFLVIQIPLLPFIIIGFILVTYKEYRVSKELGISVTTLGATPNK